MRKKRAAGNRSNSERQADHELHGQRLQPEREREQEQKERSALDTYRMWLNESSSSSSSSEGSGGGGGRQEAQISPRPPIRDQSTPPREPSPPPREPSPPFPHGRSPLSDVSGSQHLQPPKQASNGGKQRTPRSHSGSPRSSSSSKPHQSSRFRLPHPRRFLAQSLRTMLPSPSPSPSAASPLHPRVPPRRTSTTRRGSADNGMATLYGGDAWLAQPRAAAAEEEKPGRIVRTSGAWEKPGFDEVSLDEEKGGRRRSYRWEYRSPDGPGAWAVALGGVLALWAAWSPMATYPLFAAYYDRANRAAQGLGAGHELLDPARGTQGLPAGRYSHRAAVLGVMTGALHVASVHVAMWASSSWAAGRGARSLQGSVVAGVVLAAGGFFGAAFCRSLGGVCVLQGVVAGVGCGLLAAPAWWLVPRWFSRRTRLAAALVGGLGAGGLPLLTAGVVHVLVEHHGMRAGLLLHAALALALGPLAGILLRPRTPAASPSSQSPGRLPLFCLLLSSLLGGCARTVHLLGLPAHARRLHSDAAYAVYALAGGTTVGAAGGAWLDAGWWPLGDALAGLVALAVWTPAEGLAPVVVAAAGVGVGQGLWLVLLPMAASGCEGDGRSPRVLGLLGLAAAVGALVAAPAAVAFEDRAPGDAAWLPALAGILSLGAAALALLPQLARRWQNKPAEPE